MMVEFILTLLVFLTVVSVMAIGVMRGREPISGSCGGLGKLGVNGACEICGGDTSKCRSRPPSQFYDAS